MFFTKAFARFSTFQAMIAKKDWTGALESLERLGERPEPATLDLLMSKLYSTHKHIEAYKLLMMLPELGKYPNELDYTLAIESCLEANKLLQALNIFYQSQLFGITLDASLYSNLLLACNKETGSRNLNWILCCMQRDQILPSITACTSVIKLAITIKDFSLIEIVLKLMIQAKYELPSKLISSFILKNASEYKEYKSLKSFWNNIQQKVITDDVISEKDRGIRFKLENNSNSDNKSPYSFELIMLPKQNSKHQVSTEESTSDDSE